MLRAGAMTLSVALLPTLAGCAEDACLGAPPAFELEIVLEQIDLQLVEEVEVGVEQGTGEAGRTFDVDAELDDGRTTVVVRLDGAEVDSSGFHVRVGVDIIASGGKRLGWAEAEFDGSADACNFFSVTVRPPGGGDAAVDGDDGGAVDLDPPPICLKGWCWENPRPLGVALHDVWGTAPEQLFAVGEEGAIIAYDGSAWRGMVSGTTVALRGVGGTGATDVFAVGEEGKALRFDGSSWQQQATSVAGTLRAVAADQRVLAVGDGGAIIAYDRGGAQWSAQPSAATEDLLAVWTAGQQAVVAGRDGVVLVGDGTAWSSQSSGTTRDLWAVWRTGAETLIAGQSGVLRRLTHAGSESIATGRSERLVDLWGGDPSDVYLASAEGVICRYDGVEVRVVTSDGLEETNAAWGQGSRAVLVGAEAISHFDGSAWRHLSRGTRRRIRGLWGGEGMIAVGGSATVVERRAADSSWHAFPTPLPFYVHGQWWNARSGQLVDVTGAGAAGELLVLDEDCVCRFGDGEWRLSRARGERLTDIWGVGATEVYAVGDDVIYRYDGEGLQEDGVITGDLYGVAAAGGTVFAVGSAGAILRKQGTGSWAAMTSGTDKRLYAVWALSPSHAVAVGWGGTVVRWDGATWDADIVSSSDWLDVHGRGASDCYIVGATGYALHWDGSAYVASKPTTRDLGAVWAQPAGDVFVAGEGGVILRRDPGSP